jgi:superfamily II DNA or RNA helicase
MIKILISNTHSKFVFESKDEQRKFEKFTDERFSVVDQKLLRDPLVLRGIKSSKISFYDKEHSLIPTGLIPHVKIYGKKEGFQFSSTDYRNFDSPDPSFLKDVESGNVSCGSYKLRDYQCEALSSINKYKNGNIEMGTGLGKGLIMAALCHLYNKSNILCLFNRVDLIQQTYDNFIKYGIHKKEIGIVGSGQYNDESRITLLSVQSYQNIFHLFPKVKIIIMDEVHETGRSPTAEKIIYSCQNASQKIGFSATISVIDNEAERMKLYSNVGPIIYKKEYAEGRSEGSLASVHVSMYEVGTPNSKEIVGSWNDIYDTVKLHDYGEAERWEENGYTIIKEGKELLARKFIEYGDASVLYVYNEERNKLITQIVKSKERVLILFTNINHGRELKKLLPDAVLISGEDDKKSREQAKILLRDKKDSVVIASDIWSTGVDIPQIKTLILAGSSVSTVKVIQKIGRSTRNDKSTDKITAEIVDFYQIDNALSIKQSKKRKNVYENILKIPVKIIK